MVGGIANVARKILHRRGGGNVGGVEKGAFSGCWSAARFVPQGPVLGHMVVRSRGPVRSHCLLLIEVKQ